MATRDRNATVNGNHAVDPFKWCSGHGDQGDRRDTPPSRAEASERKDRHPNIVRALSLPCSSGPVYWPKYQSGFRSPDHCGSSGCRGTSPRRSANTANCVRERAPSFFIELATCDCAVRRVTLSFSAICWLDSPSTTSATTSSSRLVNCSRSAAAVSASSSAASSTVRTASCRRQLSDRSTFRGYKTIWLPLTSRSWPNRSPIRIEAAG